MNVFYFGCWNEPGHYLWKPNGTRVRKVGPFDVAHLDGFFTPASESNLAPTITYIKDWTVMAMWDRSVDTRPGSNAAFIVEGIILPAATWVVAFGHFPYITARLRNARP